MKPKLKAPGTKRLNLKCDKLLSIFAFKFHLRRYTMAGPAGLSVETEGCVTTTQM